MSGRVNGRVALVTGGASGIGAAVVEALVAEGARACVADLPSKGVDAERLVTRLGADRVHFVPIDVTDEATVEAAYAAVERVWGPVDLLVTSAGVDSHPDATGRTPMHQLDPEHWNLVMDVNLLGTFLCCRSFARRLVETGRAGTIVTLASLAAKKPKGGVYSVSKAGVWMLTRVLASELGADGIRVNTVAPGLIDTPMLRHRTSLSGGVHDPGAVPEVFYAADLARLPLPRLGTPTEVADVVVYLSCDESSYVTGSLLSPDGGFASVSGGG